MDYLYDGTFDGLLNCIYAHYYNERATGIYIRENYQCNLLNTYMVIETYSERANKVFRGIINKISDEAMENIYNAYLSNDTSKEMKILNYIIMGLKIGRDIDKWHTHECVNAILVISQRVSRECHSYLGLIRFVEVGDYLYAPIEPDNNILPKIASHFADRLRNEQFIIHDKKRNLALAYRSGEFFITDFVLNNEIEISENEKHFQCLWKNYFDTIAIESRKNPNLQRNFIPLKRRKHVTEFNE